MTDHAHKQAIPEHFSDMNSFIRDVFDSLRGDVLFDVPLGQRSWFGCGGMADIVFRPLDSDDLSVFVQAAQGRYIVLGALSNVIVRDLGVREPVIRLGKHFSMITPLEDGRIRVGAGALDSTLSAMCARSGIGGLEFFSGVPGTVGGALRMNAGCYEVETKDVLIHARVMDPQGKIHLMRPEDMGLSYRSCGVPESWIFLEAEFQGIPEDPEMVSERIAALKARRLETQPIREKTSGSTFANPQGHKAWALIDQSGARDLRVGGAILSPKHCNFMINTGTATASDLENLGEEVRKIVFEKTGIDLVWEVRRIGAL